MTRRYSTMLLALAAGLAPLGCQTEGGSMVSRDEFSYVSTEFQPKTVRLLDIRTQEELWVSEVPVGEKLSLAFYRDQGDDVQRPDLMRWGLGEPRRGNPLSNVMAVPPAGSRLLTWEIRETPELPGSVAPTPLTPAYGSDLDPLLEPAPSIYEPVTPAEPQPAESDAAAAAAVPLVPLSGAAAGEAPAAEAVPDPEPEPVIDLFGDEPVTRTSPEPAVVPIPVTSGPAEPAVIVPFVTSGRPRLEPTPSAAPEIPAAEPPKVVYPFGARPSGYRGL